MGAKELGQSMHRDWPRTPKEALRRKYLALSDERDQRLAEEWSASIGGRELTARDMPVINALILERLGDLKKLFAVCERLGSTDLVPTIRREMIALNLSALRALDDPTDPPVTIHLGGHSKPLVPQSAGSWNDGLTEQDWEDIKKPAPGIPPAEVPGFWSRLFSGK